MDARLITETCREILADWRAPDDKRGAEQVVGGPQEGDGVIVSPTAAGFLIVGVDPYGVTRSGCRLDGVGLAHELAAIAEREWLRSNPLDLGVDIFDVRLGDSQAPVSSPPSPSGGSENGIVALTGDAPDTGETAATDATSPSLYSGTALSEDEISRWRNELMTAVDEYAEQLIAEHDPLDPAEIERTTELNHLLIMQLITEEQRTELDRLNAMVQWRESVRRHATGLKAEVAGAAADWLEIFDIGEGWPKPPGADDDGTELANP